MSGNIRILPQDVVVLIAAGEVVERPAACIKEMVENSLDAGASAITVAIQGGGMDSIRVTDNGQGIAGEDLRLVFHPHATSKLHTARDLQQIGTLGFRGEALASIARVSRVTLTTRQPGSQEGTRAVNEGGQMLSILPAAGAEGTSILVQDLFYNAPVRRDFLGKPQKEAQLCGELMQQLMLSRPDVAFRFVSDGKQLLASPGDGQLQSALLSVYGLDVVRGLIPVEGSGQGLLLCGFVGVGEQARGNRSHQHFFVNGRAIKSQALSKALEEACRHRVMVQRYPLCALNLTLPHGLVDVNVHPNKWEVRLAKEAQVLASFSAILQDALLTQPLSSPPPLFEKPAPESMAPPSQVSRVEVSDLSPVQDGDAPARPAALVARDVVQELPQRAHVQEQTKAAVQAAEPVPKAQEEALQEHLPGLRQKHEHLHLIGTAFDTYILAQQGERLLLIDQHALHERLNFDRMMARSPGEPQSQTLLLPQVLELDYPSHSAFLAYREVLRQVGFEAEDFGQRSVRLMSVPVELGQPLAARSFQDALDQLQSKGRLNQEQARERIIMAACKGAVKGGQRLPQSVLQNLVDQMQEQGVIPSCPHGRPILLELTKAELEKRFGRIQA